MFPPLFLYELTEFFSFSFYNWEHFRQFPSYFQKKFFLIFHFTIWEFSRMIFLFPLPPLSLYPFIIHRILFGIMATMTMMMTKITTTIISLFKRINFPFLLFPFLFFSLSLLSSLPPYLSCTGYAKTSKRLLTKDFSYNSSKQK